MSSAEERRRKRASLLLAFLLMALAVILTIELFPDRVPEGPSTTPATPSPKVSLSSYPSPTPSRASSETPSLERAGSGGGITECRLTEPPVTIACPENFTIAGDATGLYPGTTVPLSLTIQNPNHSDIRVTSITVAVTGTSRSSCGTTNLNPTDYTGPGFVVLGNGSRTISLSITMSHGAPDACQNVAFTLSYGGKAEAA